MTLRRRSPLLCIMLMLACTSVGRVPRASGTDTDADATTASTGVAITIPSELPQECVQVELRCNPTQEQIDADPETYTPAFLATLPYDMRVICDQNCHDEYTAGTLNDCGALGCSLLCEVGYFKGLVACAAQVAEEDNTPLCEHTLTDCWFACAPNVAECLDGLTLQTCNEKEYLACVGGCHYFCDEDSGTSGGNESSSSSGGDPVQFDPQNYSRGLNHKFWKSSRLSSR